MVKVLSSDNWILLSPSQHDLHRTNRRPNLQHYLLHHDTSRLGLVNRRQRH